MLKLIITICFSLSAFGLLAHGGGVDKNSGHNCSDSAKAKGKCTGYHYHHKIPTQAIDDNQIDGIRKYNREEWQGWIDGDRDCQNTRAEVLIRDSLSPVIFVDDRRCRVIKGQWYDPYTAKTFTLASDIDIDHIVPLAHAHYAGAHTWSDDKRKAFFNDSSNLLAVEDNANQQKSAKAPHQWMPENKTYHCKYLLAWQHVKAKYQLSATIKERDFIQQQLTMCQESR